MDSLNSFRTTSVFQGKNSTSLNFDLKLLNHKQNLIYNKNNKRKNIIKQLFETSKVKLNTKDGFQSINSSSLDKLDNSMMKNLNDKLMKSSDSLKTPQSLNEEDFSDINPLVSYYHFNITRNNTFNEFEKYNDNLSNEIKSKIENKYKFIRDSDLKSDTKSVKKSKPKITMFEKFFENPQKSRKKLFINKKICEKVSIIAIQKQKKIYEDNYIKIIEEEKKIESMPYIRTIQRDSDRKSNNENKTDSIQVKSIEDRTSRSQISLCNMELTGFQMSYSNNKPNARAQSSLVISNNTLYLFGGVNTKSMNDLWECKISDKLENCVWKKLSPLGDSPLNRYGHTSIIYKDEIIIFGGLVDCKFQGRDDIIVYSISENRFTIDEKCTNKNGFKWRRNHIAQIIGNHMLVHGGISNEDSILDDIWSLDLNNLRWNQVLTTGNKNNFLAYHCSTLILSNEKRTHPSMSLFKFPDIPQGGRYVKNNKIEGVFLFGGIDQQRKFNDRVAIVKIGKYPLTWFYPEINGIGPEGLINATVDYFERLNIVILFGGENKYQEYKNDVWIFEIDKFSWISVNVKHEIPKARSEHVSIITRNEQMLILGGIDGEKYVGSDFFVLDLKNYSKKSNYFDFSAKKSFNQFVTKDYSSVKKNDVNIKTKDNFKTISSIKSLKSIKSLSGNK